MYGRIYRICIWIIIHILKIVGYARMHIMILHMYNEFRLFRFRTSLVSHAWNASWRVRCWAAARAPAGSSAPDWNWSSCISTRECRTWCTGYAATSRRTLSRARRCSACRVGIPGWRNGWGPLSNVGVTPIWRRPDVHRPPRPFSDNIWRNFRSPSCHPLSLADCSTCTPVRAFQSNLYLESPLFFKILKTCSFVVQAIHCR